MPSSVPWRVDRKVLDPHWIGGRCGLVCGWVCPMGGASRDQRAEKERIWGSFLPTPSWLATCLWRDCLLPPYKPSPWLQLPWASSPSLGEAMLLVAQLWGPLCPLTLPTHLQAVPSLMSLHWNYVRRLFPIRNHGKLLYFFLFNKAVNGNFHFFLPGPHFGDHWFYLKDWSIYFSGEGTEGEGQRES